MDPTGPERVLVPGQQLRFARPMVSFLPEGHLRRTTDRGPLISRDAAVTYVGPYPGRPGIHIAEATNGGVAYEVPFRLHDLR